MSYAFRKLIRWRYFHFGLWLLGLSLLASCNPPRLTSTHTPTVTHSAASPSPHQPTTAASATATMTRTARPTPRPRLTPLPSFTPSPTASRTPTLGPPPLVITATYQLTTPQAELLVQLWGAASQQQLNNYSEAQADLRQAASSLQRAVEFELGQQQPVSVPYTTVFSLPGLGYAIPVSATLLSQSVLDYLNTHALPLQDQGHFAYQKVFQAQTWRLELDRDAGPEWLVQIDAPSFGVQTWLALDELTSGVYQPLPNDLYASFIYDSAPQTVLTIQDLTGDALDDVLIHESYYQMGRILGTFSAFQGSATGLRAMTHIPFGVSTCVSEVDYTPALTTTAQGVPMLSFAHTQQKGLGCVWQTTEQYTWPNGVPQHTTLNAAQPDSAACHLVKGVWPSAATTASTALRELETAVRDFAADPPGPAALMAFARYRLAVAYAQAGRAAEARTQLAELLALAPAARWDDLPFITETVPALLAAPTLNPVAVCDAAYGPAVASDMVIPEWGNYLAISVRGGYPCYAEVIPTDVCPLPTVFDEALPKLVLPQVGSPAAALTAAGFNVVWATPLAGSGEQAWLVILGLQQPHAVVVRQGRYTSTEAVFAVVTGAVQTWTVSAADPLPAEFAVAYPVRERYGYISDCAPDTELYSVLVRAQGQFTQGVACWPTTQPFALRSLLADANGDGVSDWVQAQTPPALAPTPTPTIDPNTWLATDPFFAQNGLAVTTNAETLDDLDDRFYAAPTAAATRALLRRALAAIPTTTALGAEAHQHLSYLLARSYELTGETAQAIALYQTVWASTPNTGWRTLAASHLQAVGNVVP